MIMIAEIISIGTELLLGQIVNTNAAFIAKELAMLGINTYHQSVVGDNTAKIKEVIKIAEGRSDLLIFIGGLGPTQDDVTKQTVASYLNEPLELEIESLKSIRDYFEKTGRDMTENNQKQAYYFKNGRFFKNANGHAIGTYLKKDEKAYLLVPGPPIEMERMFHAEITPFLATLTQDDRQFIVSKTLRFYGIGESTLVSKLNDLIENQSNPTIAPYAGNHEVSLRITASGKDERECQHLITHTIDQIFSLVGDFYYGEGDDNSLVKVVGKLLQDKKMRISSAESLTGGLFQSTLVSVPQSSKVFRGGIVAYEEAIKRDVLGVSPEILETEGMVSEACAISMADKCREKFGTEIGISFTGVAGPDSLEGHPAGTVWIGISQEGELSFAKQYRFMRDRNGNRSQSVMQGLDLIRRTLLKE